MDEVLLRTACPLDCPDACSLEVTLTMGRITKIDAAPVDEMSNPLTDGWICKKVKHHADRVYSPERIMTPLIRIGKKGDGEFRQASWDEALDLVAAKITDAVKNYGVDSVLPYLYNSSASKLEANYLTPHLFARLGAPEILPTICAATYGAAWDQMFGEMLSIDTLDVVDAKLVVVWGANPAVSGTHLLPLLAKVQKAGGKLVVIDPRATGTASRADLHLAVRPGTDVVLAYALANELVRTNRVDREFIETHTTGSKEFLAAATKYSLEDASNICGISLDMVRELAELIATVKPAVLRMGYGPERNRNGGSSAATSSFCGSRSAMALAPRSARPSWFKATETINAWKARSSSQSPATRDWSVKNRGTSWLTSIRQKAKPPAYGLLRRSTRTGYSHSTPN